MARCLIGVGSNLGNRQAIVEEVVAKLRQRVASLVHSRWYTYPAIGGPAPQEDFLNGALLVETEQGPLALANLLHQFEAEAGRERTQRWASRLLDLDLLLVDQQIISSRELTIPHPRMVTRRFVLEPAAEIAPDWVHPEISWTIRQLLEHLSSPPWFAVVGPDPQYGRQLAAAMAAAEDGVVVDISASDDSPSTLEFAPPGRPLAGEVQTPRSAEKPIISVSRGIPSGQPMKLDCDGTGPKLLLITEPRDSAFSRGLFASGNWQRPTLYLSSNRQHALQDAIGAVQAMK